MNVIYQKEHIKELAGKIIDYRNDKTNEKPTKTDIISLAEQILNQFEVAE